MAVEHKNITDPNLHEIKGASTATSGQIPVANGSGSSVWTTVSNLNKEVLSAYFPNLADATSIYIPTPVAGTVKKIYIATLGAIDANTVITAKIGVTAVTNGTISVTTAGAAAGTVYSASPTANNVLDTGEVLQLESNGAATSACAAIVTILLEV